MTRQVDHAALRTNQAFIVGLLILAYVVDQRWLVAFVAAVMAIGTVWPQWGLFRLIYQHILRDRVVKPTVVADNPEPHRFSMGLGAVVLAVSLGLFGMGAAGAAWVVVGVVVLLAGINLFAGFCAGCFVYYWLARREVSGFNVKPVEGTLPGMRPR